MLHVEEWQWPFGQWEMVNKHVLDMRLELLREQLLLPRGYPETQRSAPTSGAPVVPAGTLARRHA